MAGQNCYNAARQGSMCFSSEGDSERLLNRSGSLLEDSKKGRGLPRRGVSKLGPNPDDNELQRTGRSEFRIGN